MKTTYKLLNTSDTQLNDHLYSADEFHSPCASPSSSPFSNQDEIEGNERDKLRDGNSSPNVSFSSPNSLYSENKKGKSAIKKKNGTQFNTLYPPTALPPSHSKVPRSLENEVRNKKIYFFFSIFKLILHISLHYFFIFYLFLFID